MAAAALDWTFLLLAEMRPTPWKKCPILVLVQCGCALCACLAVGRYAVLLQCAVCVLCCAAVTVQLCCATESSGAAPAPQAG
jgi:hypothetical protein